MSAPPVSHESIAAFADAFIATIERGDADAMTAMYTPDARIWHNFDDREKTREEERQLTKAMVKRAGDMRYENIRRIILDDGFVQQHVLRTTAPDGTPVTLHAMLRAWCDGSAMSRLEEYLDPAQAAPLFR